MKLKKYRGQHLLTDKNIIRKIVRASGVTENDNVLEIGAGTGLLTQELASTGACILSFEIDRDFHEMLSNLTSLHQNLTVTYEDFLNFSLSNFLRADGRKWRVIANIPYNITSPIIEKIIKEGRSGLKDAYLLVQKEVAQRITAKAGQKEYGRLTVFTSFFCKASILFTVPPHVFTPPPKVDSALIRLELKEELPNVNTELFFKIVASAFQQRRKTIKNTLKQILPSYSTTMVENILLKAGIDPTRRGETLSTFEFERVENIISKT